MRGMTLCHDHRGRWLNMPVFTLCVCVWVSNDDPLSHHSMINELVVIQLSLSRDLWDDCADICSPVVPPITPAEMDDFEVEVKASDENVIAGQSFNITCVDSSGHGFQQQWLHPKKQARIGFFSCLCFLEIQFSILYGFIRPFGLSCTISFNPLSRVHVISNPAALSLKLANNGLGPKPSSGKRNIALRMALSGYKVCVRTA